MNTAHIILAFAWTIYCVLHSVLAAGSVKRRMERWLGSSYRYYRFAYTVFAFAGLVGILLYQVTIHSPRLFVSPLAVQVIACALASLGAALMMLNIIKYFIQLSGVRWLVSVQVEAKLERKGLHRYVRHPLYFSTFLFIWSLWLVYPYLSLLYTLIALKFEEEKLLVEFGEEYETYRKEVPMILPWRLGKN
jgi:methanethiol S-methyltransferase